MKTTDRFWSTLPPGVHVAWRKSVQKKNWCILTSTKSKRNFNYSVDLSRSPCLSFQKLKLASIDWKKGQKQTFHKIVSKTQYFFFFSKVCREFFPYILLALWILHFGFWESLYYDFSPRWVNVHFGSIWNFNESFRLGFSF